MPLVCAGPGSDDALLLWSKAPAAALIFRLPFSKSPRTAFLSPPQLHRYGEKEKERKVKR